MRAQLELVQPLTTVIEALNRRQLRFSNADEHLKWALAEWNPFNPEYGSQAEGTSPEGHACWVVFFGFVRYGHPCQVATVWRNAETPVTVEEVTANKVSLPDPPPRDERAAFEHWLRLHDD